MPIIKIPLSQYIRWKIKKFWNLSAIAKKFDLSVVKQEILHNQLIGLDTVKRKLLLVRKQKDKLDCRIVDLQQVNHCSIKKVYSSISAGEFKTNSINNYLQSISLQIGFKTNAEPVVVNFYESSSDKKKQQSFLEATARKWEQFVSDLLDNVSLNRPAPSF